MTPERKKAYLALLSASFIWGIAPPVIKYTLKFITPFGFLFYRFLITTIIALPFFLQRIKKIRPSLKDWLLYFILGFLCAPANLSLLFWGIQKTSSIDASVISIASPIMIVLGGAFFLKEQVTPKEILGIVIAFIGTIITIIQPLLETNKNPFSYIEGNILVFAGTIVWVAFVLLTKKNLHLDPIIISLFSFMTGLIFFLPFSFFQPLSLPLPALPGVFFMSIFSSLIAYTAYTFGLSKIEASEATVFTYLQPIFALPVAILLLQEKPTFPFILGSFLVILGVFICEHKTKPSLS